MENELEVSKRKIRETEELNKRLYKNLRLLFSLFQIFPKLFSRTAQRNLNHWHKKSEKLEETNILLR